MRGENLLVVNSALPRIFHSANRRLQARAIAARQFDDVVSSDESLAIGAHHAIHVTLSVEAAAGEEAADPAATDAHVKETHARIS
jgi:hypothetical protein